MSTNENKSGRPKKKVNPFNDIFRKLIGSATQQDVADKIGVSRQNVGRWLLGDTTPDINTLSKIADAYKVSTDYLLGRTPNKTTDANLKAVCEYTGLSEKAVENIRGIAESTKSPNTFFEYEELNIIIELLIKIKAMGEIKRYFSARVVEDLKSDETIKTLTSNVDACNIFNSSIISTLNYALKNNAKSDTVIIPPFRHETIFDDVDAANTEKTIQKEMLLAEYELTEHCIRALIQQMKKGDSKTDSYAFKAYDFTLLCNLNEKLKFEKSFYIPQNGKARDGIEDEIEALEKLQEYFEQKYLRKDKKDGDHNG